MQGSKASCGLVSFVIPTFEEEQLGESLDILEAHLRELRDNHFEIVIVDDSGDRHKVAIDRFIEERRSAYGDHVVVRAIDGRGRGKGDAIRLGALAALGSVVFTMDADIPVPLDHVTQFLRLIDDRGFDVVIGERPLMRNFREPLRCLLSRALFAAQRFLVFGQDHFDDTQCGFKAFRRAILRDLANRQIVSGGMYDVEYLYAARRRGAAIARVPVVPNAERRASKIRVLHASIVDPIALVRVKLSGLAGRYD
jgi:dolichyl-phosphate beta-glucosyltransferase